MKESKRWLACLDLSDMDESLIGYMKFLTSVVKPEAIIFFHAVESGPTALEIVEQFPELETEEELMDLIRNELKEKIDSHFDDKSIQTEIIIKPGKPTDQIIDMVNSREPDLLLMGKKVGYSGEGIIAKRILKYVASSILFVPENSRYTLKKALVPVDFSEHSAKAVKTAKSLVNGGNVTAQHIYHYRAQFFPYHLSGKEKREIDKKVEAKKNAFIEDYNISEDVDFVLSLHKKGGIADVVYNQAVKDHTDLIIITAKPKKINSFIRYDFTDKVVDSAFGIPLLVQKNRKKHQKFLKVLFKG